MAIFVLQRYVCYKYWAMCYEVFLMCYNRNPNNFCKKFIYFLNISFTKMRNRLYIYSGVSIFVPSLDVLNRPMSLIVLNRP